MLWIPFFPPFFGDIIGILPTLEIINYPSKINKVKCGFILMSASNFFLNDCGNLEKKCSEETVTEWINIKSLI